MKYKLHYNSAFTIPTLIFPVPDPKFGMSFLMALKYVAVRSVEKPAYSLFMNVQKSLTEKLEALEDHLFHIKENLARVKEDESYYKILAATLRVLVCKTNSNKPLLLKLTNTFNYKLKVDSRQKWNPNETEIDFKDYITRAYYTVNQPISLHELILNIAQQDGTGHEDNSLEWKSKMTQQIKNIDHDGVTLNLATVFINQVAELTLKLGIDFLKSLDEYRLKRTEYWN